MSNSKSDQGPSNREPGTMNCDHVRNHRSREQIQQFPIWPKDCWRQEDFTSIDIEIHPDAHEVWGKAKAQLDARRKHESKNVRISVHCGGRVFEEDAIHAPKTDEEGNVQSSTSEEEEDDERRDRRRRRTPSEVIDVEDEDKEGPAAKVPPVPEAESSGKPAATSAPEGTEAGPATAAVAEEPPTAEAPAELPQEAETRPGTSPGSS
jgi:hypothetical protein